MRMLCALAIKHQTDLSGQSTHVLRITGRTSTGPSGTGGRDGKEFDSEAALLAGLASLGIENSVVEAAERAMRLPEYGVRFVSIAEDVQIPFKKLEKADIYLFD